MGKVLAFRRGEMLNRAAVPEPTVHLASPTGEPDWIPLLQRIAQGDQTAVADLYDATSHMVFGLALRILSDRAIAEDVVVEVYSQVWGQAQTYDVQRGTPLSWLLTVTRSRAIDALRSRQRVQRAEPLDTVADAPDGTPGPEEISSTAERRRVISQALASLSPDQRQVIEMAYYSDLSHSEIAARLGQPLGTVKTRIRTGLLRLRERLGPLAPPAAAVS
ncbi:MAG: sigma-70 family RNA polymerase sigma factor [Deltaproteobacteria bacterium]|nr:sigma-70 family RNA polymerase sigma factor [Deltaproteobacteria bacterium]